MLAADSPPKVEQPCVAPVFYNALKQAADSNPGLVFTCVSLVAGEPQRDSLLRAAFLYSIEHEPALAARHLPQLISRKWVTDPGFFSILTFAHAYPSEARELLILAARRYPNLALRESAGYLSLPYGKEVFEAAVIAAPDEAVGVASGNSPTGQQVFELLRTSKLAQLQMLAGVASKADLNLSLRQRVAVFSAQIAAGRMTLSQALQSSTEARYFAAVASLRFDASAGEIPVLDRVLETYAEVLFRTMQDRSVGSPALAQLSARDVYLLSTYGRTEEDDALFGAVFDRLLIPKMRSITAQALLEQAHDLNLRHFLAAATAHHRLEAFLAKAGSPARQAEVLARCFTGLQETERPLDAMLAAAGILDSIEDAARLRALKEVVLTQYARGGEGQALYGLLATSIARKLTTAEVASDAVLQPVAARFGPYLREPRMLEAAELFDARGICVEQYIFYDDDDANESYNSFRQTYTDDPRWHWEDHGWYVHVTAMITPGRQIEIYANVQHSPFAPGTDDRRHELTKLLLEQQRSPAVVVHRGHTWYVSQSLEYLTNSARLVFLGSCRGMEDSYSVIALANHAQMIATRGIGTTSINDSLLHAINDELLSGAKTLDWERFWRGEQVKLGANPMFRDYIPPSRNAAAIMLAAYYNYLAAP